MKRKEATATTTTERKATFSDLLDTYGTLATKRNDCLSCGLDWTQSDEKEYTVALKSLATAISYSVLKKCIDTGYNATLVSIRSELTRDTINLENLATANETACETGYNENGDVVTIVTDKNAFKSMNTLIQQTLGDGLDLVNTAVVAILSETDRQLSDSETVDLECPYTVRRLKRKVYIKTADSVGAWETVETSPIREIYKEVRRAIMASRATATDSRNGYTYLSEIATDTETGETTEIYRRLPKYADLGGQAVSCVSVENAVINRVDTETANLTGRGGLYSADSETVDRMDSLLESLHLTPKQEKISQLRLRGYGNKAIATYLGVSADNVKGQMKEIQRKARKNGLEPR